MRYTGLVVVALTLLSGVVRADEGMWWPDHLSAQEAMLKRAGVRTSVSQLQDYSVFPLNAVARINGCSAAFISKKGLLLTSYSCIERHMPPELKNLTQPFTATQPELEMPLEADVQLAITEQVTDITLAINRQLSGVTEPQQRYSRLKQLKQQYVAECQSLSASHCQVYSFYNGLQYYLVRSVVINDVRVAHFPSRAIRQFGGENDHGAWPQHKADYIVLRAYMGGDAKPAPYSPENKPFQPAAAFNISASGVMEGDTIVVPGYPSNNQRLSTAAEIIHQFEQLYPLKFTAHQQFISVLNQLTAGNTQSQHIFNDALQQLKQQTQQYKRIVDSYQQSNLPQRTQHLERQMTEWINSSPVRQQLYLPVMQRLQQLLAQQNVLEQREQTLQYLQYARLPAVAKQLYAHALDRSAGVNSAEKTQALQQSLTQLDTEFNLQTELEMALIFQRYYSQLPVQLRLPALDRCLGYADNFNREIVRHKLETLYRNSDFTSNEQRHKWLERTVDQFEQSNDTLISLAVTLHRIDSDLAEQRQQWQAEYSAVKQAVTEVVLAFADTQGDVIYPDANGTIRLAVGKVNGYQPQDGIWFQPFSTVRGLIARHRAVAPFLLPETQLQALRRNHFGELTHRALRTLPVNFLSNADTNSGSRGAPTLNAKAELVGMVIDMTGNHRELRAWSYDAAQDRTVHLDSRYLLWQLQQADGGAQLLEELNLNSL